MRQSAKSLGIGLAGLLAGLALVALAAPAQAQFGGLGGLIGDTRAAAEAPPEDEQADGDCATSAPSAGRRILGGILGRTANDAAGRAGISSYVPVGEFSDQLTTAIACRLDPDEQRQAAEATVEATRGVGDAGNAEVGASSNWVSDTREGVSGTSTVTGRERGRGRDDRDCITVSDVIIVDGEETRADKRMCRQPPSPRYAIAA